MATYYIDATGGADGNVGSQASPWQTLSNPNNAAKTAPGDTILFKCGEVWRGQLLPPEGGTQESERITYGQYGAGANPLIIRSLAGAGGPTIAKSASWSGPDGNGEYYYTITGGWAGLGTNAAFSVARGDGVTSYSRVIKGTKGLLAADNGDGFQSGVDYQYWYKPPVGHTPDEYQFELSNGSAPCYINNKDYITVTGIDFYLSNSQQDPTRGVVTVALADYVNIIDCCARYGGWFGVTFQGATQGSVKSSTTFGFTSKISDNCYAGVDVRQYSGIGTQYITIDSLEIYNNSKGTESSGDRGGIISVPAADYITVTHNYVHDNGNTVTNLQNATILIDGGTYWTVRYNYIANSPRRAISMGGTAVPHHNTIQYNIISNWGTGDGGYSWTTAIWATAYGAIDGANSGFHNIDNNVLYNAQNIVLYGIILRTNTASDYCRDSSIRNNIIYCPNNTNASSWMIELARANANYPSTTGPNGYIAVTNNCISTASGPVHYRQESSSYATAALYEASAYNHGQNSLDTNPLFVNGGGSYALDTDFQIQVDSPCINAGVNVGLTTDYGGDPIVGNPDIGAWEYVAPGATLGIHIGGPDTISIL